MEKGVVTQGHVIGTGLNEMRNTSEDIEASYVGTNRFVISRSPESPKTVAKFVPLAP